MKFLVLGSGMMGYALAYDLARSAGTTQVTLADIDLERARSAAARIPHGRVVPASIDVSDEAAVTQLMMQHDGAAAAVSFRFNESLTRAAIAAKRHLVDLGGNDDVVARQRRLDPDARQAGVTIVPNCGLAPGLINILAAGSISEFDSVESVKLRVGGLPQHPRPPLNYQITFSVEGLLNEYSGRAEVLREGRRVHVEALTEIETINFPPPFGAMEAFITSGGASLLPEIFEGKVKELDYKTIRYPGHCERFKALMDLGFASNDPVQMGSNIFTEREVFSELLRRKLPTSGPDVVLLSAELRGFKNGHFRSLSHQLVDYFDVSANISGMMRMTSFPASVILQYLAQEVINNDGVLAAEQCVPLPALLSALNDRGIAITRQLITATPPL
ncbi:MAG: saccharopine dehydrogenase NADP-binding domain-containing protein [Bacteroidetes bacterium]|jgi:lysine 6-dehydrogenase|nr:saccharopine dehydrogenase NADP-binding domain-containing protein [Bacteroidota bacterium]